MRRLSTILASLLFSSIMIGQACVDCAQIDSTVICFTLYAPVCGCNGVTYSNDCVAENLGGVTS